MKVRKERARKKQIKEKCFEPKEGHSETREERNIREGKREWRVETKGWNEGI